MNGISHKQAIQLLNRRMDGLLNDEQLLVLDEHLQSCDSCRAHAVEMDGLAAHMQNEFHRRWDKESGPTQNVMERVTAKARRIPMTNRFSSGIKLFAGALALIILAVAINFVVSRLQSASPATNPTQTVNNAALPADRLIAFTSEQNGNVDIYTMHADGSGLTNVTNHSAYDGFPFWSPDGRRIVFMSDRDGSTQIYLMEADGSNVVQVTHGEGNYGFDGNGRTPWSPDGKKLIFSHASPGEQSYRLYVIDITDKSIITLTNEPGHYIHPSWSPDGRHIAFTADTGRIPQDLFIVSSDGNGLTKLTEDLPSGEFFMFDYEWSQDGTSLFFTTDRNQQVFQKATYTSTVYEASIDGSIAVAAKSTDKPIMSWWNGIAVRRESEPRLSWLRPDGSQSMLDLCSDNGQLFGTAHKRSYSGNLVVGSNCSDSGWMLYWTNPDGTMTNQLLNSPVAADEVLFSMTWSPDDRYLAFVSLDTASPDVTETLYILDVVKAREDPSIQPLKMANSFGPSWQPIPNNEIAEENTSTPAPSNSSYNDLITFTADSNADRNGNMDVYTVRIDGNQLTNLTHDPSKDFNGNDYNPQWSPDRKKIAFISMRGGVNTGDTDIFTMDPNGSNLTRLTNKPGYDVLYSWSPDGQQIVYFSSSGYESYSEGQLVVMNSDGSKKTVITKELGLYYFWNWSPDGQKIIYAKQTLEGETVRDHGVYIVGVNGENPHPLNVNSIGNVRWEDSEHFIGVVWPENPEQAKWSLYRFSTDGNSPLELASHNAPIVAVFEKTYVVAGKDTLDWFTIGGNSTHLSSQNFAETCETSDNQYLQTNHTLSPDHKHAFVVLWCEDTSWFYLENEDGSEIVKLGTIEGSPGLKPEWSLDGKLVSLLTFDYKDPYAPTDLYLFDIEKMLADPSTQPMQTNLGLTVNGETIVVWPPEKNDKVEKRSTTEPDTFSLSLEAAELLADFDLLEPSGLPAGYTLEGIAHDPWTQRFIMKYSSQQNESSILIYQGRGDWLHYPELRPYVTSVEIGDLYGEFIQGEWIYETPEITTPRWDETANVYSLNWQRADIVFSISYRSAERTSSLQLEDLMAIAESLK